MKLMSHLCIPEFRFWTSKFEAKFYLKMPFLLTLGESLWSQKNASIEMEIYFIEETINFIKKKKQFFRLQPNIALLSSLLFAPS